MSVSLAKLLPHATDGERRVAERVVAHALASGCTLSVNDGEEWTVKQSRSAIEVLGALGTTGEDTIRLRNGASGERLGSVYLVWGNAADGSELIADHTDNAGINALVALIDA